MCLYFCVMDHQFTGKGHGHCTFFYHYKTIFAFLFPLKQVFWKLQIYIFLHYKGMYIKMKDEVWNLNLQLVCALGTQCGPSHFSSLLLALSIETQNDTYEFAVHILLLSSRANDCNQSDFLCSGKAKKLHSERCSHVISVMWSAMTDSWMACLCGRHRMLIFNDSFFHKKSQL